MGPGSALAECRAVALSRTSARGSSFANCLDCHQISERSGFMEPSTVPAGLYARLLGDSWSQLSDAVRGLHCGGSVVRCTGVMRVSRGSSLLTRWMASLLGLPAAGDAVPVTL